MNVPRAQQPQNIADLQASMTRECENVPRDIIERAFDAVVERCQKCIAAGGLHSDNEYFFVKIRHFDLRLIEYFSNH